MAAKKKNTAGMAFIVKALKRSPKAQYADVKAKADKKGLTIYPIMYGRAQALLGIVKSAKRGTGKYARGRRESGHSRMVLRAANPTIGSPEAIIAAVKGAQQEQERYRMALEAIRSTVAEALA